MDGPALIPPKPTSPSWRDRIAVAALGAGAGFLVAWVGWWVSPNLDWFYLVPAGAIAFVQCLHDRFHAVWWARKIEHQVSDSPEAARREPQVGS